eukprot:TRINITY_DN15495_c0_g1_i1.p1 TRINITY_DN15495_c0_g1~~TRINITY_DN15495_c0_g1_i1.p1  ORF type:complete len:123 (-),score=13.70 TRINITY_DN15495_c0_g1_i1:32-400(-)
MTISRIFRQYVDGITLVCNVTCRQSFNYVSAWIEKIKDSPRISEVKLLVANKVDLVENRMVAESERKSKAAELGIDYYETSVKINKNANEAFDGMIKLVYRKRKRKGGITLSKKMKRKRGCC